MFVALDVGNSSTNVGLFGDAELVSTFRLPTKRKRLPYRLVETLGDYITRRGGSISEIAVASVVPRLEPELRSLLAEAFGVEPLVISVSLDLGISLSVDEPGRLGVDRIVNAVGARRLVGSPVIVVDFGTATTVDVVDGVGRFIGGAIAPGLSLGAQALSEHTAQLPQFELRRPRRIIGGNTVEALQVGSLLGHAALVEGLVRRFQRELAVVAPVIATGGYAERIAPFVPEIDAVIPQLTLQGIRLVADRGKGRGS